MDCLRRSGTAGTLEGTRSHRLTALTGTSVGVAVGACNYWTPCSQTAPTTAWISLQRGGLRTRIICHRARHHRAVLANGGSCSQWPSKAELRLGGHRNWLNSHVPWPVWPNSMINAKLRCSPPGSPPMFSKAVERPAFRSKAIKNSCQKRKRLAGRSRAARARADQKPWLKRTTQPNRQWPKLIGGSCEHNRLLASTATRSRAEWQPMRTQRPPQCQQRQLIQAGNSAVREHEPL